MLLPNSKRYELAGHVLHEETGQLHWVRLVDPDGEVAPEGQAVQIFTPLWYVLMGQMKEDPDPEDNAMQALLLEEPAGEVAPEEQALQESPFR